MNNVFQKLKAALEKGRFPFIKLLIPPLPSSIFQ